MCPNLVLSAQHSLTLWTLSCTLRACADRVSAIDALARKDTLYLLNLPRSPKNPACYHWDLNLALLESQLEPKARLTLWGHVRLQDAYIRTNICIYICIYHSLPIYGTIYKRCMGTIYHTQTLPSVCSAVFVQHVMRVYVPQAQLL